MSNAENLLNSDESILEKTLTGIEGLDDITGGGLPQGRPTLVCGAAGCGKTIFAMEFIVHGAEMEKNVFILHLKNLQSKLCVI